MGVDGRMIGDAIIGLAIVMFIAGCLFMGFIFWLVPWLWDLIKPWLHTVTA